MAEAAEQTTTTAPPPARYGVDAKWDACLDLSIRHVAYSSLAGAFAGLLLFRSPTTRWVSVALGAGVGIGAAYTECSYIFNGNLPKWSSKVSTSPEIIASCCFLYLSKFSVALVNFVYIIYGLKQVKASISVVFCGVVELVVSFMIWIHLVIVYIEVAM